MNIENVTANLNKKKEAAKVEAPAPVAAPAAETPKETNEGMQVLYKALIGLAPTLIGALAGGSAGGAAGAKAGAVGLETYGTQEKEKEAKLKEKAEKAELAGKELKKEKQEAAKFAFEKSKFAQEQSNKLAELELKKQETLAKSNAGSDTTQKMVKLGAEGKARLDNARASFNAIQNMAKALDAGQNTFSPIGDNDYTLNRTIFEEALGRMQSGGAITKEEEKRFSKMAPTLTDTKEIQKKKLQMLTEEMKARMGTLGFTPEEFGLAAYTPENELADQVGSKTDWTASVGKLGAKDAMAEPIMDPIIEQAAKQNNITYDQAMYLMQKRGYGSKKSN